MAKPPPSALDNVVSLAKRRGFVYPCGEIYGGTRSAWDYGPLGVELKENIKRQWWRSMVQPPRRRRRPRLQRHPADARPGRPAATSSTFTDPLTECQSCHKRFRADHLQEDVRRRRRAIDDPDDGRPRRAVACPNCGTRGAWTEPRQFNMTAQDLPRRHRGRVRPALPAPRDRAGHLPQLRQRGDQQPQEAAVRHRPDRQELPQRDHAGQLHLPHPRVRADGDGVLRQARRGRGVAPVLDRRAHPLVRRPRHRPRQPAPLRAPAGEARRTTPSAPSTSSTASASPGRSGASSRASPTAPTSTSSQHSEHSGQDLSYFDQAADERYVPYVIEPAAGLTRSPDGVPGRRLHRGRGAQHQGRRRQARRARLDPRLAPVKVAVLPLSPQRRPVAQGQGPRRRAAPQLERRLRRLRRDRPPLPPPGRDRHAVLRDRRLRHPRRPRGHRPRARHDEAGAGRPRPASRRYFAERLVGC